MTNDQNNQKITKSFSESQETSLPTLPASDKLRIVKLFGMVLPAQKVYGKTSEDLQGMIEDWAIILADCKIEDIENATWDYVKNHDDFPAPANIMNIIKHGYPEPRDNRYVKPTQTEI